MSLFLEDFTIGACFISPPRTFSEGDVGAFAALTGDIIRLHTDEDIARATIFGRRIVHGAFVFSVATGLSTQTGMMNDTLLAFYAVEKLRFLKPVFIGDSVHVRKEVVKTVELGTSKGLVTFQTDVLNQSGDIVLAYQDRLLIKRREG